ncbi:MAG: DUF996 domain-containing protein [Acidilobaceae archaeon]
MNAVVLPQTNLEQELKAAKLYGAIGTTSLLVSTILAVIPYVGIFLTLTSYILGLALLLLAFKKLSDVYNRSEIFKNAMIWLVLDVVASLLAILGLVAIGVAFFEFIIRGRSLAFLTGFLSLLLSLAIFVVSAFFYYRAVSTVAEVSKNELFKWSGICQLVGALTLILLIGFFLMFVAEILLLIAFLELKSENVQLVAQSQPT